LRVEEELFAFPWELQLT